MRLLEQYCVQEAVTGSFRGPGSRLRHGPEPPASEGGYSRDKRFQNPPSNDPLLPAVSTVMRPLKALLQSLCILALSHANAWCGPNAGTGITGSKHDLNFAVKPDYQGRVCIYCHIAHEPGGPSQAPLWQLSDSQGTFIPYKSATYDPGEVDIIAGPSRLCLSCHDGVIAHETHPGLSGDNFGQTGVGANQNLANDHPIGFDFIAAAEERHGIRPAETRWLDGKSSRKVLDSLYKGRIMTCATCHDMHNINNVADADNTYNYFVYSRQKGSSLCLTCHDK